jgi:hypothetical protein
VEYIALFARNVKAMNENLVGYLLDALDPEDRREVETYLAEHPDGRRQLDLIQRALAPLAVDRDVEPPAGLWVRALARVAEYRCRPMPAAPKVAAPALPPPRGRWRRADVLVAAGIFLCVSLLLPPGINRLRYLQDRSRCADNLAGYHQALVHYGELHNGRYPRVDEGATPATVWPVLRTTGSLPAEAAVDCPANGRLEPERRPGHLADSYAYSLGYKDHGVLHGLCQDDDGRLPVMADRPMLPNEEGAGEERDNSPNHRHGQNVLYRDGHVTFCTDRHVGVGGDDIFLNREGRVGAGLDCWDTVLGSSRDHP